MKDSSTILVVDDEPKNIRVIANLLSEDGYNIEYAINGKEAINWANHQIFDLILLDVMMPELDGYETCKQIQKIELQNNTPIIFVTAKTDTDSTIKGFNAGGVDYITKPFQREELLARIKTHIELKLAKEDVNRLYENVKELNKDLNDSINYASYIQSSILPSNSKFNEILPNNFIQYLPKDTVSGDFYWIRKHNNKIFLAVGDCTGHGVPGAMLTMLSVSILTNAYNNSNYNSSSEIVNYVVNCISEYTSQNKKSIKDSVELGLCIIDTDSKMLQYSSNKFPLIIATNNNINKHIINNQNYEIIKQNEQSRNILYFKPKIERLTKYKENNICSDLRIQLSSLDNIYMYSDGVIDQFGGIDGKKFKRQNLMNLLAEIADSDMSEQGSEILNKIEQWKKGYQQIDDITIVGFSLKNVN